MYSGARVQVHLRQDVGWNPFALEMDAHVTYPILQQPAEPWPFFPPTSARARTRTHSSYAMIVIASRGCESFRIATEPPVQHRLLLIR